MYQISEVNKIYSSQLQSKTKTEDKQRVNSILKKNKRAPGEDRTRDLSLTKRTHYHYATEAEVERGGRNNYLSSFSSSSKERGRGRVGVDAC